MSRSEQRLAERSVAHIFIYYHFLVSLDIAEIGIGYRIAKLRFARQNETSGPQSQKIECRARTRGTVCASGPSRIRYTSMHTRHMRCSIHNNTVSNSAKPQLRSPVSRDSRRCTAPRVHAMAHHTQTAPAHHTTPHAHRLGANLSARACAATRSLSCASVPREGRRRETWAGSLSKSLSLSLSLSGPWRQWQPHTRPWSRSPTR